jgi:hypothetical protein
MLNNWVEIRGDALKICKYTKRPIPHRAESIGPWIGNLKTLVWLSSITMSSFAYLFHPSTNIHSPYTPVFTLLAILLSEHLYVVLSSSIQRAVSMVPNWAENLFRREEYELKKLWLSRVTEVHDKRHIGIDDASDITDDLSLKMWNNHLDRDSESSTAIELIQNAFKVK